MAVSKVETQSCETVHKLSHKHAPTMDDKNATPLADYVAMLQAEHGKAPTEDRVCLKSRPRMMRSAKAIDRMEKYKAKKEEMAAIQKEEERLAASDTK